MNGDGETKLNYRGLSDNEWYNRDEIASECDNEDEDNISKPNFQTLKLPKQIEDYKWKVGTYFYSKQEFQEGMRTLCNTFWWKFEV